MKIFTIRKRIFGVAVSEDWDGWDVGLFSCRIVPATAHTPRKILRVVVWRLAVWAEL